MNKKLKITVIIIAVVLLLGAISSAMDKTEKNAPSDVSDVPSSEIKPEDSSVPETDISSADASVSTVDEQDFVSDGTPQGDIEAIIRNRIKEKYTNTVIDRVTINSDLGTDDTEDYIALIYLTWNVQNSGATSKKVLSMYSEDLAATVGSNCANVQEIAIFWTVPYLNDASAKCSYERKGEGMYEMDMMWDSVFK